MRHARRRRGDHLFHLRLWLRSARGKPETMPTNGVFSTTYTRTHRKRASSQPPPRYKPHSHVIAQSAAEAFVSAPLDPFANPHRVKYITIYIYIIRLFTVEMKNYATRVSRVPSFLFFFYCPGERLCTVVVCTYTVPSAFRTDLLQVFNINIIWKSVSRNISRKTGRIF